MTIDAYHLLLYMEEPSIYASYSRPAVVLNYLVIFV